MQWLIDLIISLIPASPGFVDRGDPVNADWTAVDINGDNNWHDLDVSSIVPDGTTAIVLRCALDTGVVSRLIRFRKKGNVGWPNVAECRVVYPNRIHHYDKVIACDENRFIQYKCNSNTWTVLNLTVAGWFGPES